MNSTDIAKTNNSVAILHLHTNDYYTAARNGDEVLINIQYYKPHNIKYENSLINVYKLVIHFMICHIRTSSET